MQTSSFLCNITQAGQNVKMQQLDLKFKGSRTYIQGGDIFNAVGRFAREADITSYVSHLAFRHFARQDCDLVWDRPELTEKLIAQGRVTSADNSRAFWVMESSRPSAGRYPYDEESVVTPAIREGEEILLRNRSMYTPIEEIIALTKRLNYELTPDIDGKWLFGQLNLRQALPDEYASLVIRRKSEVAGRFSVNAIEVDGHCIGDIRFIVGAP